MSGANSSRRYVQAGRPRFACSVELFLKLGELTLQFGNVVSKVGDFMFEVGEALAVGGAGGGR